MQTNIKKVEINYRISLAETDSVGVVYFANYLAFFEKGHQEFLRSAGINNAELIKNGIYLPIVETKCNYHMPLFYDDLITIQTSLNTLKTAYLEFNYNILKSGSPEIFAHGYTLHICANSLFKPTKIPKEIILKLNSFANL